MARKITKNISVRRELRKLFPSTWIRQAARQTGAVVRQRKVKVDVLFRTLVLGGSGHFRSLAALRRRYEKAAGHQLEESSFYNRFTEGQVRLLQLALARALKHSLGEGRALRGRLATFLDVLVTDSTVIRLHEFLADDYPACRTNHTKAALKAHAVISMTGAGKQSVKIRSERRHDGPVFRVGRWVRDNLLLFDLAYYRFGLFSSIRRNGGYFVSRLKASSNPIIVATNRKHSGRARHIVGKKLRDVTGALKRQDLDVMVEVRFRRRAYGGRRSWAREVFRVVGLRHPSTGAYHLYITNLPADKFSAQDIQLFYALRWEIELLFKEWKSYHRLAELPSSNKFVVQALLYASLISFPVSRHLLAAVRRLIENQAHRLKPRRWASIFASLAPDLLLVVTMPAKYVRNLDRRLLHTMLHEALDPNVSRPSLLQAVEAGLPAYCAKCASKW